MKLCKIWVQIDHNRRKIHCARRFLLASEKRRKRRRRYSTCACGIFRKVNLIQIKALYAPISKLSPTLD